MIKNILLATMLLTLAACGQPSPGGAVTSTDLKFWQNANGTDGSGSTVTSHLLWSGAVDRVGKASIGWVESVGGAQSICVCDLTRTGDKVSGSYSYSACVQTKESTYDCSALDDESGTYSLEGGKLTLSAGSTQLFTPAN